MIITEVKGNAHSSPELVAGLHKEKVWLDSSDLVKRIQRLTTDHGNEIGLRLPPKSPDLRDGDVLLIDQDNENAVLVAVNPTDVLVITADSITQMAFVAHSLGNRHLQAQFFDADSEYGCECMVVAYDHTVVDFLTHHNIAFDRQDRVMPVPFRHSEHTH